MTTFWGRATHSVYHVFSLYFNFCKIIIWKAQGVPQLKNEVHPKQPEAEEISPNDSSYFPLWFEGKTFVLIASVPGHCLPLTMYSLFDGRTLHSESMYVLVFVCL